MATLKTQDESRPYRIYTLSDPVSGRVRYVGITRLKLAKRLNKHVSFARQGKQFHTSNWIRSLLKQGLRPIIIEIEATSDPWREKYWIEYYRSRGEDLTNASDGCEGQLNSCRSLETRAKISVAGTQRYHNLSGRQFGRLRVLELAGHKPVRWLCLCECGEQKAVKSAALVTGRTQSCGCLSRELAAKRTRSRSKHGLWKAPEYSVWTEMKAKCHNPKHARYSRMGGLGIEVCERWRTSFENFLQDMGPRPPGCGLGRRDPSKDYTPDNCYWETFSERSSKGHPSNKEKSKCA